jgi:ribulose kinase
MSKYYFVETGETVDFGDIIVEEDCKEVKNGVIETIKKTTFNKETMKEFIDNGIIAKVETKDQDISKQINKLEQRLSEITNEMTKMLKLIYESKN